jgi:DNA-binding sugar fermentation-stimulating protein
VEYNYKLLAAKVESVYNNLIVDVRLENGELVTAFCCAMEIADMCKPKTTVWLKRTSQSKRLVKYNIAFVHTPEGMVFANPRYNRQLFQEAFEAGILTELSDYTSCRALSAEDKAHGLDFELMAPSGKKGYVFISSIFSKSNGCAVFPHKINFFEMELLEEMRARRRAGNDVFVVMIVPREDCISAKFSWTVDPIAAAQLFETAKGGVNFLCYGCKIAKNRVELNRKMEILY